MSKSLKEKIKFWVEFLKLAHRSTDRVVIANLRESRNFYSAWVDYRNTKFNEWWKSHSSLFKDREVLSVPKAGDVVTDESFYVRIPYTYAPSTVGRIVSEMYDRELTKRTTRTKKMRKVYGGTFSLSRDDYQVAQFYYYLIFVRDVYLPLHTSDPRTKSGRYIDRSKEVFNKVKRKTTEKREIPFTNPNLTYESASRLVRRYKQMAEKLLRNVSSGVFPGDYEEAFIKNQSQIRAERAAKAHVTPPKKRLRGRPKSMDQIVTKRVNPADPYAGSKRKIRTDKGIKRGKYSTQ
jgi:hypothetical protein